MVIEWSLNGQFEFYIFGVRVLIRGHVSSSQDTYVLQSKHMRLLGRTRVSSSQGTYVLLGSSSQDTCVL